MEKVKVTQEQADAIERLKSSKQYAIRQHVYGDFRRSRCLSNLSLDELVRTLYIGYEVEPDIKVGDFVDIGLFGINKVVEVTGVKGDAIAINGSDEYNEFKVNRILTDEEKQEEKTHRWWSKHDRDVWELNLYDCVINEKGKSSFIVCVKHDHIRNSTRYELSNGAEYPKDAMKHYFKVLYFTKDRKDIEVSK